MQPNGASIRASRIPGAASGYLSSVAFVGTETLSRLKRLTREPIQPKAAVAEREAPAEFYECAVAGGSFGIVTPNSDGLRELIGSRTTSLERFDHCLQSPIHPRAALIRICERSGLR